MYVLRVRNLGKPGSNCTTIHRPSSCCRPILAGRQATALFEAAQIQLQQAQNGRFPDALRAAAAAPSSVADPAASEDATSQASNPYEDLEYFLGWLIANGVKGVEPDGKVSLFQQEGGERGLVCEQPLQPGDVVLEVPLRLALTDHPADDESNALLYEGAPWSVRLACKLLRHRAAGAASPWAPYIRVLPAMVPAPLETFAWEDIVAVAYPPAQEALHAADWLRADAFSSSSPEARGGLGEEDFYWALSVVHSRTFANAAPGGGVGVRMLVPLVDMMNHGGDQLVQRQQGQQQVGQQVEQPAGQQGSTEGATPCGLSSGRVVATDNVRWDLVPPERSSSGGWAMVVSATAPVAPGQELLLSYGERPNDDFFLHYGFVPPANPHDDAVLWPDLASALDWHYERFGVTQMSEEQAEPLYRSALELGQQEQQAELQQQAGGAGAAPLGLQSLSEEQLKQLNQIKVVAGGQVSAAVMRAFTAVSGGDAAAAEAAVACRCAELLHAMATYGRGPYSDGDDSSGDEDVTATVAAAAVGPQRRGLLADLAALAADAEPRLADHAGEGGHGAERGVLEGPAGYWAQQLAGYHQLLLPRYASLFPGAADVPLDLQPASSSSTAATTTSTTTTVAPKGLKGKYGLPPPGPTASQATSSPATAPPSSWSRMQALVRAHLPTTPSQPPVSGPAGASVYPSSSPAHVLSGPLRLAMSFRAYKQMVLWDLVLRSGVPPEQLARFVGVGGGESGGAV